MKINLNGKIKINNKKKDILKIKKKYNLNLKLNEINYFTNNIENNNNNKIKNEKIKINFKGKRILSGKVTIHNKV